MLRRLLLLAVFTLSVNVIRAQEKKLFNAGWEFVKDIDTSFSATLLDKHTPVKWQNISLPHTASIEPVEKQNQHWQGICFYRKFFSVPERAKGKYIALQFDAAMQVADVYLNGKSVFKHYGGYLPFCIDISKEVNFGKQNSVLVKLDNRNNALVPPGKSLETLDFNYYSGLYRNAWFIIEEPLHISNVLAANKVAGGGLFVHYENVSTQRATLILKTEVDNSLPVAKTARTRLTLIDKAGKTVSSVWSNRQSVKGNQSSVFMQNLVVERPDLWSPDHSVLYSLRVELEQDGKIISSETIKTGIKSTLIKDGALYLNGQKLKIRGTNRHQDYPYIGNALSDNAQYRDAYKIKLAGFNFVRTSHYPQSSAFMDACDELGIMVMDAIPGWQFIGESEFQKNSLMDIRTMIRRDRNHPSVILWEASLNESEMTDDYMQKAHAVVHEELPFTGVYSAGWKNSVFDVFLPARQHAKAPDYWKKYNNKMPLLVAEYGDWEYYAQNAGFNQTGFKDLKEEARTSRQLRGYGQKRLLQQALNYQEAHNDNLYGADMGDANWLMFDYNRGYAPDIESSGIMDIMRLPKFSFYFYKSQTEPVLINGNEFNKPMAFIASYWQSDADTAVKVYSNCDEVALLLNGKVIARRYPDKDTYSVNLKHPPFSFHVNKFIPGTLTAVGYLKGKEVVKESQHTAGMPAAIKLRVDYSGKALKAGENDLVFVYADVVDANGTVIHDAASPITFNTTGNAEIIGQNPRPAEAGTSAILLKAGNAPATITVSAKAAGLTEGKLTLTSK